MKISAEQKVKYIHLPIDIKDRLTKLGAECVEPEHIVRKSNFDTSDHYLLNHNGWIYLQDEIGKITLSYKQLKKRRFTGKKELTVKVDSFETADAFFDVLGFESCVYREMKKESWRLEKIKIDIITWPWLPSFSEVEAPSKKALRKTIEDLGLRTEDCFNGSIGQLYEHYYDISAKTIESLSEIKFGTKPGWVNDKMKNGSRE